MPPSYFLDEDVEQHCGYIRRYVEGEWEPVGDTERCLEEAWDAHRANGYHLPPPEPPERIAAREEFLTSLKQRWQRDVPREPEKPLTTEERLRRRYLALAKNPPAPRAAPMPDLTRPMRRQVRSTKLEAKIKRMEGVLSRLSGDQRAIAHRELARLRKELTDTMEEAS